MNTKSDRQNNLNRILQKIGEIAETSADGDYIFRGEARSYREVCSNLYRACLDEDEMDDFDIAFVQKEILDEARKYVQTTDDLEILIELQHLGGKTNLIDFTTDSHIALFFACNGSPNEDGRVILQRKDSVAGYLERPRDPKRRVIAQKAVYVQPPEGFVTPDVVIIIPADLKPFMLEYLRKFHGISTETIFNDLHGFIINWDIHKSAYTQFHKGRTFQKRADMAKSWPEKQQWYEKAIVHYNKALELKADMPEAYNKRGLIYSDISNFERAIQNYSQAIALNPEAVEAYNNRGIAYHNKGDFERAIQDYSQAIALNPEDADTYNNRGIAYHNKGDFERAIQDYNTALHFNPEDATAYNNRGYAYLEKGDLEHAIQDYTKATQLQSDYTGAYFNRGIAYADNGALEYAIQDFTRVINLKPDYAGAYLNRGAAYADKGDQEAAICDYKKAVKLNPDFADVIPTEFADGSVGSNGADTEWTPDRFKDLVPEVLRQRYDELELTDKLYELGAELKNFIQEQQWELTDRFWMKHIFFFHKDRRLFGFNLFSTHPRFTFCSITESEAEKIVPDYNFTFYPQYSQWVCERDATVTDLRELFEHVYRKGLFT